MSLFFLFLQKYWVETACCIFCIAFRPHRLSLLFSIRPVFFQPFCQYSSPPPYPPCPAHLPPDSSLTFLRESLNTELKLREILATPSCLTAGAATMFIFSNTSKWRHSSPKVFLRAWSSLILLIDMKDKKSSGKKFDADSHRFYVTTSSESLRSSQMVTFFISTELHKLDGDRSSAANPGSPFWLCRVKPIKPHCSECPYQVQIPTNRQRWKKPLQEMQHNLVFVFFTFLRFSLFCLHLSSTIHHLSCFLTPHVYRSADAGVEHSQGQAAPHQPQGRGQRQQQGPPTHPYEGFHQVCRLYSTSSNTFHHLTH